MADLLVSSGDPEDGASASPRTRSAGASAQTGDGDAAWGPVKHHVRTFKASLLDKGRRFDQSSSHVNIGNSMIARETVERMRTIINSFKKNKAADLIELMRYTDEELRCGMPFDPIVSNMVRRVLKLIREAYAVCVSEEMGAQAQAISNVQSLHDMLLAPDEETVQFDKPFKQLKSLVIQAINDLLEDLEESCIMIANQALEHIHSAEVIMTAGRSRTVEAFLIQAAKKRKFHVMVAESAPSYQGQDLAVALGQAGIETTLITDSAVFAVMSRVNKVIIGTHTVMADGGLMALNGAHALTLAAKHHSVPVIVCAAMFKLCPKYICQYNYDDFNYNCNPASVLDYSDARILGKYAKAASTVFPLFDYVPADLVTLFVSNIGAHAPSYVYRMLSEYYDEADTE